MRRASKTIVVAVAALLIAFGLAACGGGDDSTTGAGSQAQAGGNSGGDTGQGSANSGDASSGSDKDGSSGDQSGSSDSAGDFVPKSHDDSGGGSGQYKVKGGDNSVQEFGEEADSEEFNAAAVALHNFLDARAEANWAAACEYMANSVVESFEKLAAQAKQIKASGCAEILEKLTNPAAKQSMKEEAEKANVGSLRVEDEQSFVIYTGIDGTVLAMPMTNENGTWKVASLAGTPLS